MLIVIDTLRADRMGCYGHDLETTPNIDRLAERSVLFDRAFSNSDGTILTHISLLSSRYTGPREFGPGPTPTLAEVFSGAGYRTYGIAANPALVPAAGWARGFDWYTDQPVDDATLERLRDEPDYSRHIESRSADQTSDFVLQALRRHRHEHPDQPWFLFVNYLDPHDPYTERKPWSDDFRRSTSNISGTLRRTEGRSIWNWVADTLPTLTPADVQRLGELYDAEIAFTDRHIQRVLEYIDETDQSGHTVILITSDHGEALGERGLFTHMLAALEPEINVPLILHVPKMEHGRARSDELVESVDVAPTLLSLAGIEVPGPFRGRVLVEADGSLRSTGRSRTLHTHHAVNAAQRRSLNFPPVSATDSVMLRFAGGKLYLFPDDTWLTFDLDDSPVELPQTKVDELVSTLRQSALLSPAEVLELPPETREAIRSLGYSTDENRRTEPPP